MAQRSTRVLPRQEVLGVIESVAALAEEGKLDVARRTLEGAVRHVRDFREHEELLAALDRVPEPKRMQDAAWAVLTARMLCNARRASALLAFTTEAMKIDGVDGAWLRAYHAWALVQEGFSADGLACAEAALRGLPVIETGFAWRVKGEALACLEREGWREAFEMARTRLSGRALGTCLVAFGHHLDGLGDAMMARRVWHDALGLMPKDPYYMAWLHHELGRSYLRDFHPAAESHMLEAQSWARKARASAFASRAALGVGLVRRAMGEWSRAEASYREAIKLATESFDRQQALRGLGHTLRLAGQPSRALEPLLEATRCAPSELGVGTSWVFADVAAAHVQLLDEVSAVDALGRTGDLYGEDLERAKIVQAELARRRLDANGALELLRGVRFDKLWAREERACFPVVFALGEAMGLGVPEPLPRPEGLHVEVNALGVLRARVNEREVPIRPTSRPGEVLVLLLERGRVETVERLLEALFPKLSSAQQRRKAQALSALVRELRDALGWEGSVLALGGAYQLDPGARWEYDVDRARERGQKPRGFLEGVYTDWARQTERELRDPDWRDLN
jgi:tetratricopeptide (TPR) repeat protein